MAQAFSNQGLVSQSQIDARRIFDALAPFGVVITDQPLTPSRLVALLESVRRDDVP